MVCKFTALPHLFLMKIPENTEDSEPGEIDNVRFVKYIESALLR